MLLYIFMLLPGNLMCSSRKYHSIPTPRKAIGNSEGEGVSTAKICKGTYEAKLEIRGVHTKKPFRGGMDINFY